MFNTSCLPHSFLVRSFWCLWKEKLIVEIFTRKLVSKLQSFSIVLVWWWAKFKTKLVCIPGTFPSLHFSVYQSWTLNISQQILSNLSLCTPHWTKECPLHHHPPTSEDITCIPNKVCFHLHNIFSMIHCYNFIRPSLTCCWLSKKSHWITYLE